MNQLLQLKQYSTIVADTGDFQIMRTFMPHDATTNPSLILKAVKQPQYQPFLEKVIKKHHKESSKTVIPHLLIAFGREILNIIPGRVSTEVDAHLSFDTQSTIEQARYFIELYESEGIPRERVLIKIASTWEGIRAAEILEKEKIRCNMTLLFSLPQAVACADAKVQLISPFVGRITDWYKKQTGLNYTPENDPGVESVKRIYNYFYKFEHHTEIMAASFRNTGQILALTGCDLLTISPELLNQLASSDAPITRTLSPEIAHHTQQDKLTLNESDFRAALNADPMAKEKLAEGIENFCADINKLANLIDTLR
jgi:transaldolase